MGVSQNITPHNAHIPYCQTIPCLGSSPRCISQTMHAQKIGFTRVKGLQGAVFGPIIKLCLKYYSENLLYVADGQTTKLQEKVLK